MTYPIKSSEKTVGGIKVPTFIRDVRESDLEPSPTWKEPWLDVEAGTTGFFGDDNGCEARTYIRIQDCGGTAIGLNVLKNEDGSNLGVELRFSGDDELRVIIRALKFIHKALVEQSKHADE